MEFFLFQYETQPFNQFSKIKHPRVFIDFLHPILQLILLVLPPKYISHLSTSPHSHCFFPSINPICFLQCNAEQLL